MIIPSIDIEGGQTVQLIGGERRALELGDPLAVIERFRRVGEVAVIDLDAARDGASAADNRSVIEVLCERAACRVGGGIRDHETAVRWLDRGAAKIIVGTAATPTLLRRLPKERVIVALDAFEGEVVTHGWRTRSGRRVEKVMAELRGLAGGFLFTLVEREGRLGGMDFERARTLVELSGDAAVTVAGGIVDAAEIAALDRMGADAQVGMALYTGRVPLADALAAPLTSDRPDGLWPTVVVDEGNHLLGLAWSDLASLGEALQSGRGVYRSRRRGLWTKGETSGATQELLRVDLDCDRDALRFTVRQAAPGFCHTMRRSCFGDARGLDGLARLVAARGVAAPEDSYTARLLAEEGLLESKLREEAGELADARSFDEVVHEAADLLYFTLVGLSRAGVELHHVERCLDRRALRVTRRDDRSEAER